LGFALAIARERRRFSAGARDFSQPDAGQGDEAGMAGWRSAVFRVGLSALWYSGLAGVTQGLLGGKGAVLMLHRVQPPAAQPFAPNAALAITPAYLERVLRSFRDAGWDIVSLDEALQRVAAARARRRFVCFTLDDGYRDNLVHAAPIFARHAAPFTVYACSSFHDRSFAPFWCALEHVIRAERQVQWGARRLDTRTLAGKQRAFGELAQALADRPVCETRALLSRFVSQHGTSFAELAARDICSWDELRALRDAGACIGCHGVSHAVLRRESEASLRHELSHARARIAAELGQPVRHLAYPYGKPAQAGEREFRVAGELGFASAVTTRKGTLHASHAQHPQAWPRVEVSASFERSPHYLHCQLSGLPLLLWNRGRLVA
jgi:peptidoglycan/xylan/chitin deacetylase (PgdA/CDA1 family)